MCPSHDSSQVTARDHQYGGDHQDDVVGKLRNGPLQIQLQKTQYEEQCEDLLDRCSNDKEREHSISKEAMQNRKCMKVAKQICSRIPTEQDKDASNREYSTTHKKSDDSLSTTTVPTPWPAEGPILTLQTISSATSVSPASPASGSGSSLTITQHKHGTQQVIDMHIYSEIMRRTCTASPSCSSHPRSPRAAQQSYWRRSM